MQAQHPSNSDDKAITPAKKHPRRLLVTAMIGAALIGYIVHKTPEARQRLESLAEMAQTLGELSERDAVVVAQFLAKSVFTGTNQ